MDLRNAEQESAIEGNLLLGENEKAAAESELERRFREYEAKF